MKGKKFYLFSGLMTLAILFFSANIFLKFYFNQFLYETPDAIKIINHPNPETDEWHRRIIPSACGIEVVNGAIFLKAKKAGNEMKT